MLPLVRGESLTPGLLRTDQARDQRRPAVDLALHEAGDLGRAHGSRLDRVLLDVALHLRPLQGIDDLAVRALDDLRSKPGRSESEYQVVATKSPWPSSRKVGTSAR